jgi:hypothetical protein
MSDLAIYDGYIPKWKGTRWLVGCREKQKGLLGIMKCVLLDWFASGEDFNNSQGPKDDGVSIVSMKGELIRMALHYVGYLKTIVR